MKTKLIITAFAAVFTLVVVAQQQRSSKSVDPDARIVSKLTEIVSIRERLAKSNEEMIRVGRAPADGLAQIELAEARVDLARERGQREEVITELQGLVAAHERRTERMNVLAKDRVLPGEVERAQVKLLEAQVRFRNQQPMDF